MENSAARGCGLHSDKTSAQPDAAVRTRKIAGVRPFTAGIFVDQLAVVKAGVSMVREGIGTGGMNAIEQNSTLL